jgi:four helix bundle protein
MNYHDELKLNMHRYVKYVYGITKKFPKEELFSTTSQFRRSSLSVILNYIEGYARRRGENCKVYKNFLEIAYGSLKESKYLLFFSYEENYITKDKYEIGLAINDKIGKMLWSIIKN